MLQVVPGGQALIPDSDVCHRQELAKFGEVQNLNVCDNLADHMVGSVYAKARGPHTFMRTLIYSSCSACCLRPVICLKAWACNVCNRGEGRCLSCMSGRSSGARAAHARIASGSAGSVLEALRGAVKRVARQGSFASRADRGGPRARLRADPHRDVARREPPGLPGTQCANLHRVWARV